MAAHAIDKQGQPIPGLYAAGEAAGEAGINGKAALEGTFLGPGIITGRVAARSTVKDLALAPPAAGAVKMVSKLSIQSTPGTKAESATCMSCHNLKSLVDKPRAGYWHFERVHRAVLEQKHECIQCHADITVPFQPTTHKIDRMMQTEVCRSCHLAE